MEITIPGSWGEVSIAKVTELNNALEKAGENPYEISAAIIAVLSDVPLNEVRKWPVSVMNSPEMKKALEFTGTEPKKRMPSESIKINGRKYTVHLYPQKWTAGMWLDYTSAAKMENDVKKMARMIACFTVPEGMEYGEGYDFDKVVDEINDHMDIETAYGMTSFFQLTLASFVKALSLYSEREMKRLKKSIRKRESRS